MMAWMVAAVNLVLLAATGFGAPAPVAIGPWELVLAGGLLCAIVLLALGIASGRARILAREQHAALLLLPAFGLPVIVSVGVAMLRDIPLDAAARSVLPYAAFLPVALLGLLSGPRSDLRVVTGPLLVAGVGQAGYLIGLFLLRVPDPTDVRSVWIARITLLDPRTTLPLLLAAAILPMAAVAAARRRWVRLSWALPVALAVGAALSTQTRSQLVAVLFGAGLFAASNAIWQARRRANWRTGLLRGAVAGLLGLAAATAVLYAIPHTRALVQAIILRSQTSVDTGRIADEWVPAVNATLDEGVPGLLGGIGAGQSFITAGGEERTYVHNVLLYGFVYFGLPGLCLMLSGYLILLIGLWRLGDQTGDRRYLALGAMVGGLFIYAQFFAVHKLFSYNLMLMLAAQAVLQARSGWRER